MSVTNSLGTTRIKGDVRVFPKKRVGIYKPILKSRGIILGIGMLGAIFVDSLNLSEPWALIRYLPLILIMVSILGIGEELFGAAKKEDSRRYDLIMSDIRYKYIPEIHKYINSFNLQGYPYEGGNKNLLDSRMMEIVLYHTYLDKFEPHKESSHGQSVGIRLYNKVEDKYEDSKTFFNVKFEFLNANTLQLDVSIEDEKNPRRSI